MVRCMAVVELQAVTGYATEGRADDMYLSSAASC